ncbi:MAG: hypothetical protein L0215_03775 [Gemmataceae bacterium]|nr:hypothetical protein [Gemmataceae bacterium]
MEQLQNNRIYRPEQIAEAVNDTFLGRDQLPWLDSVDFSSKCRFSSCNPFTRSVEFRPSHHIARLGRPASSVARRHCRLESGRHF